MLNYSVQTVKLTYLSEIENINCKVLGIFDTGSYYIAQKCFIIPKSYFFLIAYKSFSFRVITQRLKL